MLERRCQRRQADRSPKRNAGLGASAGTAARRVAVALLATALLAAPALGAAQGFVAKDDKETPRQRAAKESPVKRSGAGPTHSSRSASIEQVTLEDAVAIVRQAHGGRLVSAQSVRRPVPGYRIRIDVDGHVKSLFVDAQGRMSLR